MNCYNQTFFHSHYFWLHFINISYRIYHIKYENFTAVWDFKCFLKVNLCYFIFLKVIRVYTYCWRTLSFMSLISCHPAIKYFTEIVDFKSFLKFVCPLFSFPKIHIVQTLEFMSLSLIIQITFSCILFC